MVIGTCVSFMPKPLNVLGTIRLLESGMMSVDGMKTERMFRELSCNTSLTYSSPRGLSFLICPKLLFNKQLLRR